ARAPSAPTKHCHWSRPTMKSLQHPAPVLCPMPRAHGTMDRGGVCLLSLRAWPAKLWRMAPTSTSIAEEQRGPATFAHVGQGSFPRGGNPSLEVVLWHYAQTRPLS